MFSNGKNKLPLDKNELEQLSVAIELCDEALLIATAEGLRSIEQNVKGGSFPSFDIFRKISSDIIKDLENMSSRLKIETADGNIDESIEDIFQKAVKDISYVCTIINNVPNRKKDLRNYDALSTSEMAGEIVFMKTFNELIFKIAKTQREHAGDPEYKIEDVASSFVDVLCVQFVAIRTESKRFVKMFKEMDKGRKYGPENFVENLICIRKCYDFGEIKRSDLRCVADAGDKSDYTIQSDKIIFNIKFKRYENKLEIPPHEFMYWPVIMYIKYIAIEMVFQALCFENMRP